MEENRNLFDSVKELHKVCSINGDYVDLGIVLHNRRNIRPPDFT